MTLIYSSNLLIMLHFHILASSTKKSHEKIANIKRFVNNGLALSQTTSMSLKQ